MQKFSLFTCKEILSFIQGEGRFPSSLAMPFIAGTIFSTCKMGHTLHGSKWHFSGQPPESTFPGWDELAPPGL